MPFEKHFCLLSILNGVCVYIYIYIYIYISKYHMGKAA